MGFTAAFYDAFLWRGERRGMRERRAAVLAGASGARSRSARAPA